MKQKEKIVLISIVAIFLLGVITFLVLSNISQGTTIKYEDEKNLDYDDNLEDNSYLDLDLSTSEISELTTIDETEFDYDSSEAIYVDLDEVEDIYEITSAGTYILSGELDGQIIIETEDDNSVNLVLDGIKISSSEGSPIVIEAAEETIIFLEDGTTNYIYDSSAYEDPDENEDATPAAIFSRDDLYISGTGTLIIESENKCGIQSKDQIVINSGTITITAAKEAIKAKDYLIVEEGVLDLTAGEDGISVTEEDEEDKGWIKINGGTISVDAQYDGISAKTYLIINDGTVDITTSTSDTSKSSKGIKSLYYLEINGGAISVDSQDDAIHSDNEIVINGGDISLFSGDDGIHADSLVTINKGEITIAKSYEGIEGNNVVINDGTIEIISSDDGINSVSRDITINGGEITITAATSGNGDGLDANGAIAISDGDLVIVMPSSYRDYSSIDYDRTFSLTGGRVRILNTDGTYTEVTESNVASVSGMMGGGMQQPTNGMTRPGMRG